LPRPRKDGWWEVDRRFPCPICGKPDYCGFNRRGVVCMRRLDVNGTPTKNGGVFVPWSELDAVPPVPVEEKQAAAVSKPAPAKRLHEVYTAWLGLLPWTEEHRRHMLSRGISERDQARHGYRSFMSSPIQTCQLVEQLVGKTGEPEGVPGFYRARKKWMFASRKGILIPIRDVEGNIVALKNRADAAEKKARYRLVTSMGKNGGVSPGNPAHVAYPRKVEHPGFIGITEGEIKANIAADYFGVPVVSVPGVNNWRSALRVVESGLYYKALVCYDMENKYQVKFHLKRLCAELRRRGILVWVGRWNPNFKGIDDALVAGQKIFWKKMR